MNKNLIERFFKGDYTEEDQKQVYNWLLSRNMEHEANALLKKHWESVNKSETLTDTDLEAIYRRIMNEVAEAQVIRLLDTDVKKLGSAHKTKTTWTSFLKYAAIVVCAFGLGYYAYYQNQNAGSSSSLGKEATYIEKVTARGQKSHIILKDGSKIVLNSDSKITYDKNFGISNRDIELSGEAFFEVAKNETIPFNVTAKNTITSAIGTSFNISAFIDDSSTAISLATGKVKVVSKGNGNVSDSEVFLDPGKQYLVDGDNRGAIIRDFNKEMVLSWKENVLHFNNTEMTDLISKLERWYNVEFVVLNPQRMTNVRGTGNFKNESLDNVLRVLSYSLQFDYQLKEDKVTISF
ncbi:FecR domain-containing protein [Reichenbachiella sp. MALMAid0571]|uniref:FecR family protein n=1 Tax=Reichenbachiella sp. MALMAid0571 TaxID=3143939 RepID=UPI0032DF6895